VRKRKKKGAIHLDIAVVVAVAAIAAAKEGGCRCERPV